jgi:hypothetical protein
MVPRRCQRDAKDFNAEHAENAENDERLRDGVTEGSDGGAGLVRRPACGPCEPGRATLPTRRVLARCQKILAHPSRPPPIPPLGDVMRAAFDYHPGQTRHNRLLPC